MPLKLYWLALQKSLPDTAGNLSTSKVTAFARPECTNTTAPPYRFRSADSKTYVFLVCSFCNLLSHGFKELFLCETHTDTDLEAEPRSTTNPCDMRWFLGVCTARLFELTATRSRQTLNREELVWISGGIRCTYSWMVSISLYAHIYIHCICIHIYMYNIYICIIYIYIYTYVLVYTLYIYL